VLVVDRNQPMLEKRLKSCTVLVATPAHIIDFVEVPSLEQIWKETAEASKAVVIDEADCMLPPGGAKDWLLGDIMESILVEKGLGEENLPKERQLQLIACSASIDEFTLDALGGALNSKLQLVRAGPVQAVSMPEVGLLQKERVRRLAWLDRQRKMKKRESQDDDWEDKEQFNKPDLDDPVEKELMDAREAAMAWLEEKEPKSQSNQDDGRRSPLLGEPLLSKEARLKEEAMLKASYLEVDSTGTTEKKDDAAGQKKDALPEVDEKRPFVMISRATEEMRRWDDLGPDRGLWPQGLRHYIVWVKDWTEWNKIIWKGTVQSHGATPYILRAINELKPLRCLVILGESRPPSARAGSTSSFVNRLRRSLAEMGNYRVSTVSARVETMSAPSGLFNLGKSSSGGWGRLEDAKQREVIVGRSEAIRGLDLPAIDCVLIIGKLQNSREYMHLAGRTARCATERDGPFLNSTVVSIFDRVMGATLKTWAREMGIQMDSLYLKPTPQEEERSREEEGGRRGRGRKPGEGDRSRSRDGNEERKKKVTITEGGLRKGKMRETRRSVYFGEDAPEELTRRSLGGQTVRRRKDDNRRKVDSSDLFSFDPGFDD